jgi:hypothetical protein
MAAAAGRPAALLLGRRAVGVVARTTTGAAQRTMLRMLASPSRGSGGMRSSSTAASAVSRSSPKLLQPLQLRRQQHLRGAAPPPLSRAGSSRTRRTQAFLPLAMGTPAAEGGASGFSLLRRRAQALQPSSITGGSRPLLTPQQPRQLSAARVSPASISEADGPEERKLRLVLEADNQPAHVLCSVGAPLPQRGD